MSADESAGPAPAPETGHNDQVGQPHSAAEGVVAEAEAIAARISTEDAPRGGSPLLGAPGGRRCR
jgi:hypothetical protein